MGYARLLTLGCAGTMLALFTLTGAVQPQCTPLPVEPDCVDDTDCVEGEFCSSLGACASFVDCSTDDECLKVQAGCCPCSMGGRSTAVNGEWSDEWHERMDCPPDLACLAVYLCDDTVPACVDGACALVAPEPEDACAAVEAQYPDSARACAADTDCAVVLHQYNCCGSHYAWGIHREAVADFEALEARCVDQLPLCGCPAYPPVSDDGNSALDPDQIAATCVNGACFSYIPEP